MAAVIELEGLQKHYHEVVAVADATFAVESGEIFGLLGSNGAGKTTTVECAQGLRTPTAGRVRVLGRDPRGEAAALRGRIGCQLQESRLPEHMKVWEALDLFASLTPGAIDWRELMEQWGLAPKRNASFASLSGGQRQRLFIALALVSAPEVVFLDEMTTGLDPAARRVAWELIEEVRDQGTTVVLVTHFMDEAERLCDRVAVMDAGRIVALDTPRGAGRRARPLGARHLRQRRAGPGLAAEGARGEVADASRSARRAGGRRAAARPVRRCPGGARHGPDDLRVEEPSLEDVFLKLTGHLVED